MCKLVFSCPGCGGEMSQDGVHWRCAELSCVVERLEVLPCSILPESREGRESKTKKAGQTFKENTGKV